MTFTLSPKPGIRRKGVFLLAVFATLLLFLTSARPAPAAIVATLVDPTGSPSTEPDYYQAVEWSAYIDPSITNWIGLHNTTTPTTNASLPGRVYIGGTPFLNWIGLVDDYLSLTITNTTTGVSLTKTMDYNDAGGNESGIQSVIFGTAAAAPDVHRLLYPWGSRTWVTYDEAGAFNSFIQTAATYDFRMTYGNTGAGSEWHDNMYFLVDAESPAVPEPATWAIWGIGSLGLALSARRRKQHPIPPN